MKKIKLYIISLACLAMTVFAAGCSLDTEMGSDASGSNSSISSAHQHVWDDGKVTTDAGCETAGEKTFSCECGETYTEEIAPRGHMYQQTITDPTCSTRGYVTDTCDCGYSFVSSYIDIVDHTYTNYIFDNNASCTTSGTKTAVCDFGCGTTDTLVNDTEPAGHAYAYVLTANEDYTVFTLVGTCAKENCEMPVTTEVVDAVLSKELSTPATCSTTGENVYVYETYQVVETVGMNAIHVFKGNAIVKGEEYPDDADYLYLSTAGSKKATCSETGLAFFKCDMCQEWQDIIVEKLPHDFNLTVTDPTCETAGNEHYVCKVCDTEKDEPIAALGHAYTYELTANEDYTVFTLIGTCAKENCETPVTRETVEAVLSEELSIPATCTTSGKNVYVYETYQVVEHVDSKPVHMFKGNAIVAGKEYPDDADYLYIASAGTKKATCAETGLAFYKCENCQEWQEIIIEKLPHDFKLLYANATCETAGNEYYVCKACDFEKVESIDATGHAYTYKLTANEDYTVFTLVGTCKKEGCETPVTMEVVKVALSKELSSPATCVIKGENVYVYEQYTLKQPVGLLPHKLNDGIRLNEGDSVAFNAEGVIEIFAGDCVNPGIGYFICQECDTQVGIYTTRDCAWKLIDTKKPTCETAGNNHYVCKDCGTEKDAPIAALGHAYTYKLTANEDYTVFTLVGTCTKENCETPEVRETVEAVLSKELSTPATCSTSGENVYVYGDLVIVEIVESAPVHTYKGNLMIQGEVYPDDADYLYLSMVGCKKATCTEEGLALFECEMCQEWYEVTVEKLPHDLKVTVTEPTHDSEGEKLEECKNCDYKEITLIPALGDEENV